MFKVNVYNRYLIQTFYIFVFIDSLSNDSFDYSSDCLRNVQLNT